jgi:hypothetical protein
MMVSACASSSRSYMSSHSKVAPSVWRTNKAQTAAKAQPFSQADFDNYEIPAFLKKQSDVGSWTDIKFSPPDILNEDDFSPDDMLRKFNELALQTNDMTHISFELMGPIVDGEVWTVLCNASGGNGLVEPYWACLIHWLSTQVNGIVALNRHALRILRAELAKLDASTQQKVHDEFTKTFANITPNSWGLVKAQKKRGLLQRLKRIMA